jgi:hypothetical protein
MKIIPMTSGAEFGAATSFLFKTIQDVDPWFTVKVPLGHL